MEVVQKVTDVWVSVGNGRAYSRAILGILTEYDTGPLSLSGIRDIFDTFRSSFNEDLFFDKDGYTFDEKMTIIE
ncbi:hypothetical protein J6590_101226 [Homalodisca vitripennis]|nr:hypothetical protein J6590_101226 [Homalodisca vitripennis]